MCNWARCRWSCGHESTQAFCVTTRCSTFPKCKHSHERDPVQLGYACHGCRSGRAISNPADMKRTGNPGPMLASMNGLRAQQAPEPQARRKLDVEPSSVPSYLANKKYDVKPPTVPSRTGGGSKK